MADTGLFGGWAADPADCRYVTYEGVLDDVTAGIITPDNLYFYGGECTITGGFPQPPDGMVLLGVCDEGDGPYDERLDATDIGPETMRAKWPEIGWTTFHRCWDLPGNWRELSQ